MASRRWLFMQVGFNLHSRRLPDTGAGHLGTCATALPQPTTRSIWRQRQSNAAAVMGECTLLHPAPCAHQRNLLQENATVTNDSAVINRYTLADAQETHNV